MNEAEDLHVHSRAFQKLHGATADTVAPHGVLKEVNLHPSPRALRHRLREFVGNLTFRPKEIFKRNGPFRGANGFEHRGENFVPILQRSDLVSLQQGWPEHVPHRPSEGIVARLIIRRDAAADFLFRREKIA